MEIDYLAGSIGVLMVLQGVTQLVLLAWFLREVLKD